MPVVVTLVDCARNSIDERFDSIPVCFVYSRASASENGKIFEWYGVFRTRARCNANCNSTMLSQCSMACGCPVEELVQSSSIKKVEIPCLYKAADGRRVDDVQAVILALWGMQCMWVCVFVIAEIRRDGSGS